MVVVVAVSVVTKVSEMLMLMVLAAVVVLKMGLKVLVGAAMLHLDDLLVV
jgi:hypothetical protein